jgi:hypothetical protein
LDTLNKSMLELLTKAMQAASGAILLEDSEGNFSVAASVNVDTEVAAAMRIEKTSQIVR